MDLKKLLPGIKKNILLKSYTTFRIGGKAKYFFVAKNKEDLINSVITAKKFKLPFFVLGGGSNVLINDKGFNGLIIKNEARNFKIKNKKIIAESGVLLNSVVRAATKSGLSGLEKGSGIPGTLGGAVYGNSGWPKGDFAIGDYVEKAELLMPNGKIKKVDKKWFSFGYRNSRLKKIHPVKSSRAGAKQFNRVKNKQPIILEIVLKLKKDKKENLEKKRQEILETRIRKIPPGFSVGSIFKNHPKNSAGFLI